MPLDGVAFSRLYRLEWVLYSIEFYFGGFGGKEIQESRNSKNEVVTVLHSAEQMFHSI